VSLVLRAIELGFPLELDPVHVAFDRREFDLRRSIMAGGWDAGQLLFRRRCAAWCSN